jgi:hypothetical protein
MTTQAPTAEATQALAERLFAAAIDTLELASVHVGSQLGLYRSLADDGEAGRRRGATRSQRVLLPDLYPGGAGPLRAVRGAD